MEKPHENRKPRILIAEDHSLLRLGLRILLEKQDMEVVGEAADGLEAVNLAEATTPDVILMDLQMPNMDGIEASSIIRQSDNRAKIIMLTSNSNDEHVHASLSSGVNGYCLKETPPDRLLLAVQTVMAGDLWLDSNIAAKVVRSLSTIKPAKTGRMDVPFWPAGSELTRLELDVLNLIVEGKTRCEIARTLEHSEDRVKEAEFAIVRKLAASDRTQSALRALRERGHSDESKLVKYCGKCSREFHDGFVCCPFDGAALNSFVKDSLTGKVFADRYQVTARLGSGGMSMVYKARHKFLNKYVALKVLDPLLVADFTNARRFREEAEAASMLSHPNVINVFDFGLSVEGEPFLVMDYLEGVGLDALLSKEHHLQPHRAVQLFAQACDGLAHAHSKGVVHRDIKPSNLMVEQTGGSEQLKIIDFGIARMNAQKRAQALTSEGEIVGSPMYMSPEQCCGRELDCRSDIYSLGCALYESVCGVLPFLGSLAIDTMHMHISAQPAAPGKRFPDLSIPWYLDEIILKAMRKNPDQRYQTADEMKRDLMRVDAAVL